MRIFALIITISLAACSSKNISPFHEVKETDLFVSFIESPTFQIKLNKKLLATRAQNLKRSLFDVLSESLIASNDARLASNSNFDELAEVVANNGIDSSELYARKLALFLLDKSFACTHPLYYQYFKQRYHQAHIAEECEKKIPFSLMSKSGETSVIWLDPNRVGSIHLLFASNDDNMASRFGHVLLRLVVCPENNHFKDACDQNLYEHITIGYRANVDGFDISPLKGLFGGYLAYLYAEEFMGIYRQYAIDEFRDMYSVPLEMSQKERIELVKGLAEIHWSYTGDYKFLTKNCATLLQDALRTLWPRFAINATMQEVYLRPDSFFEALLLENLTDSIVLEDLDKAESKGFFFSNTRPIYKKALHLVGKAMSKEHFQSLDDYRKVNPLMRYKRIKDDDFYLNRLRQDERLLGAQLLIEEYSSIRARSEMISGTARFFSENDLVDIETHFKKSLKKSYYEIFSACILEPIKALMSPKKRTNGIPIPATFKNPVKSNNACKTHENWAALLQINAELEVFDKANWQPIYISMLHWQESLNNVSKLMDINK